MMLSFLESRGNESLGTFLERLVCKPVPHSGFLQDFFDQSEMGVHGMIFNWHNQAPPTCLLDERVRLGLCSEVRRNVIWSLAF